MLPTNVVSFVKKMVATNESTSSAVVSGGDQGEGSTLGKLRQTLSSSLLTATETVTKLSPTRQPVSGDSSGSGTTEQEENSSEKKQTLTSGDAAPSRSPSKYGCCRVCLKAFTSAIEFFRVCCECSQKVCEDCASYSTEAEAPPVLTDTQSPPALGGVPENTWRCSICRRRRASRRSGITPLPPTLTPGVPLVALTRKASVAAGASPQLASQAAKAAAASGIRLGIPGAGETLRRRHSDVRLSIPPQGGTTETNGGATPTAPTSSLDLPPRSPDMRRHSDVSPASLRDLEKKLAPSMSRQKLRPSTGGSVDEKCLSNTAVDRVEPRQQTPAESSALEEERRHRTRRRHSRAVPRQRSCDEESDGSLLVQPEPPVRRASAYDLLQHGAIQPDASLSGSSRSSTRHRGESPPSNINRRASIRAGGRGAKDGESSSNHVGSPSADVVSGSQMGLSAEKGMEDDRRRRRGSQVMDSSARALPATPAATASSVAAQRSHLAQQVDAVPASVRRQTSVGDAEAIKIVIDDVDARPRSPTPPPIPSNLAAGQRHRAKLRRETTERCPRTRGGFGMRVVGGRGAADGRLYASIVWTVPGGPADRAGLCRGDKVLEWCGICLTDRSFEEVSAIVEESGDTIDILVERTEASLGDSLDEPAGASFTPRRLIDALQMELDDKSPASPTRRKLPKTPEQLMRERTVSGRLQMQVWYQDERRELVVAVLAADDLATRPSRDTPPGAPSSAQSLPNAYARLRLLPESGNGEEMRTDIAESTTNPIWNATFDFGGVNPDDLMESSLEVALWDQYPPSEPDLFLGECSVELRRAVVEERPVWYRLEDPRGIRGSRSPHVSPRGSLASAPAELARRLLLRRGEFSSQRSFSDEAGGDASPPTGIAPNLDSPPTSLLHPDAAWAALTLGTTKRRGSSQSEQLDITAEGAITPVDLSRSLPGSRRSSFQSSEQGKEESIPLGRRRSSSARGRRGSIGQPSTPPEEITSHLLGRRESGRLGLGKEPVDFSLGAPHGTSTPSDDEEDDSWSTRSSRDETGKRELTRIILGPGQVQPRGFGMGHGFCAAEVKLGLLMSKGQLEVEVVCARNIAAASKDYPPDTYVKTYLRDGPRWLQKRKTRVVRRSMEPQYRQTLRYSARDVLGRSLLIMLWERTQRKSFVIGREPNQGLGGGEIALDRLQLTRLTLAWYPLFPLRSLSGAMANASDAYEGPRGPDGGPSSEEDDDGSEEPNLS
ncbi:regulating synaptic membrane exocytosis protein 2 isoform X1 [Hetaerina americana]|uniref:regulating synaptic membrane exocytosis protein 2 isoform X1 n=1 Tax=Hetaerina americana TaxID=62018 RepID=UPI003A7F3FEC